MIAKRCDLESGKKSNFVALANYIMRGKHKDGEKKEIVSPPTFTNVKSEGNEFALKEILFTQSMNTRAKGDKTYHLLISFQDGENPPPEILKKVEEELCKALGYSEHQRLSVVHRDTDNLHIHVAINKIHPTRFTMHEPYYDKNEILPKACELLEKKYGLRVDNHTPKNNQSLANAMNMEKAGGMESLVGWIQRNCLEDMRGAGSWERLHEILNKHGLEIKEKGRGLVITNGEMGVKASTVAREFSKVSLEKRLGSFESEKVKKISEQKYEKKPMPGRTNSKQLWERYKQESQNNRESNLEALKKAKKVMDRKIKSANSMYSFQKIMLSVVTYSAFKKILNTMFIGAKKAKIKAARQAYQKTKGKIFSEGRKQTWIDWLKKEAAKGNNEALSYLRSRRVKSPDGNTMAGKVKPGETLSPLGVTAKGSKMFPGNIRETEQHVVVPEDWTMEAVLQALKVANEKFSGNIDMQGSDEFKRSAVQIAVSENMNVRFSDPLIEKMHREEKRIKSIKKYIENRNGLRFKISDIPEHKIFSEEDAGEKIFSGIRTYDGASMALFKSGDKMLVLPLKSGERITFKKGDIINIDKSGIIKTKQRRARTR